MDSTRGAYIALFILIIYFLFFVTPKNFNQKSFAREKTRVVFLKILVDDSFRSYPNWQEYLGLLLGETFEEFNKQFKIKFKIKKTKKVKNSIFPTKNITDLSSYEKLPFVSCLFILERIMHLNVRARLDWVINNIDFTDCDIVLFFSGENYQPCLGMVDSILGRVALISNPQRGLEPKQVKALIIHEMGHLFGAVHVEDKNSVMCDDLVKAFKFDYKNQIIIFKNKWRDFSKKH